MSTTFEPTSPKSMRNSIWTRPEVKKTSRNWSYQSHKRNKLTSIAIVRKTPTGFDFCGETISDFSIVKQRAKDAGFNMVRMGAVKVLV